MLVRGCVCQRLLELGVAGLQRGPPTPRGLQGPGPHVPPHQLAGCAVLVGFIQVALAIMGLHQPPQLPIQGYVGHVIRCEDQQVRRLLTPADLLLEENKPRETAGLPLPGPRFAPQPAHSPSHVPVRQRTH